MADDYLATTRNKSLSDDSTTSEAELHATHDNIRDAWARLQECKQRKALAIQQAAQTVDAEFKEEIGGLESEYAMVLMLSR